MKALATYLLFAAACSGGDRSARQAPPRVDLAQEPRGRLVVAEVDGHPVYEDCVALQLSKRDKSAGSRAAKAAQQAPMTREAALFECIDFELLARRAQGAGHAADPEVLEARRVEAVRAFIDEEFWAGFRSWKDVPEADLRRGWKIARAKYDHPEYRFTVYVRAPVGKKPRPGETEAAWRARDGAARRLANEIYTRLAGERELDKERFVRIAKEVSGDRELSHDPRPFNFPRRGRAVPEFADAAFAIEAPGMVSKPTRTDWGWDIILLLEILPAVHKSFAEAKPELAREFFAASQRLAFLKWSAKLGAKHRIFPNREKPAEMAAVERTLRAIASEEPALPIGGAKKGSAPR